NRLRGDGGKTVKLADFGLARVYQESKLSGLTMVDEFGGTVPFMAPEQVTNFRQARPAADQYSAAATLYNLLTGHYPHQLPRRVAEALIIILEQDAVPLPSRRPA